MKTQSQALIKPFYISFYYWELETALYVAAVFIMSRMKVVKVSVCIYYFWSLSDCIRMKMTAYLMNLYWLNVTKCISCLFMQIE